MTSELATRRGDQIHSLCDQLFKENGRFPTLAQVRKALGDTGSYETISRYLHEWKETMTARLAVNLDLPDVPADVQKGMQDLWMLAITAARNLLEASYSPIRQDLQNAQAQALALEQELAQCQADHADEVNRLKETLAAADDALEQHKAMTVRAETVRDEMAAKAAEYKALHTDIEGQLQSAREKFSEDLRLAYTRAQDTEDRLVAQLDAEQQERRQEKTQYSQQINELRSEQEILRRRYQETLDKNAKDMATLRDRLDAHQQELAHAKNGTAELQAALQIKTAELAAKTGHMASLQAQIQQQEKTIQVLTVLTTKGAAIEQPPCPSCGEPID